MSIQSAPAKTLVSIEELAAMPNSTLYELIEGELLQVSPTEVAHGRFEHRFSRLLGSFVDEHGLGEVMVGGIGMITRPRCAIMAPCSPRPW